MYKRQVVPGAFGNFDLRIEFTDVNLTSATAEINDAGRLTIRNAGDNEVSYVTYRLAVVETGSVTTGNLNGNVVPTANVEVFISDIDARNNSQFSDVGGIDTATGSTPDSVVVGSELSPFSYPAGSGAGSFDAFALTSVVDNDNTTNGTSDGSDTNPDFGVSFLYEDFESGTFLHGVTGTGIGAARGAVFSFSGEIVRDTDGDGIADHRDLDSDNDGISDLIESGANATATDTDGDGVYDGAVNPVTGVPSAAGAGVGPVDSDNDGVDDYLDLDSDNDGIADAIEAQPTAGYNSPSIGTDTDGDGVVDTFDSGSGHGGDFSAPEDTDGDGTADYLDDDSDNDGVDDITESGLNPGADNDGDGIADNVAPNSYADTDGTVTDPATDLDNEAGDTSEVGYREVATNLVTVKTLISSNSTPAAGDTVTFQIVVNNNGNFEATNVSLTDSLPAGISFTGSTESQGTYNQATGLWTIGTLADGATATLTLSGTVDAGQGGNTIINTTTAATADQPDPTTAGDDLNESIVVNDTADLVTVKTLASGDAAPDEGDTVTFLIVVDNNGAAEATNVSLTDLLPPGLTATANNGVTSQGSYNAVTGIWTVGTIANGGSAMLTLEGTVDVGEGGNTISNITTAASGDQPDPDMIGDDLNESVTVDNNANLVTVKTLASGNSTPAEGDTVTFQIVVDNNGTAQATNVSLTDLLPAGLTATANNGVASQGSYDAATGIWTIGTIANGDSAMLTLEGTLDAGQGGNTIVNVTTAASGDQPDPTMAGDDLTESVGTVDNADLVTVKTLASGNSTPSEGDTVTFLIEVDNNGAALATNVSLTDLLPAGLTATANNGVTSQGSYDAATGIWTIGTIANGSSATLTLEGTVDIGEGGNTIVNVTTAATGDQPDPSILGDDLNESVTVDDDANLVTVKTLASGNSTPAEGLSLIHI